MKALREAVAADLVLAEGDMDYPVSLKKQADEAWAKAEQAFDETQPRVRAPWSGGKGTY